MRFQTLQEWLDWQEQLHPSEIDLGLERIAQVYQRLQSTQSAYKVITVGGTNGKGSSVAMLDAILRAAGYRVGNYTSPHLLRYNERIVIDGEEVDDQSLCKAFERVDQARGDISLSYFEFGTLAALDIFDHRDLDVVILEVGLGGRLDAVNIIDADVALITNVDIDHQAWLGSDRESIGYEKAGIMRPQCPAVFADYDPPQRLLDHADALGTNLYCLGQAYRYEGLGNGWRWISERRQREALPIPVMRGEYQLQNAAGVLMALECLQPHLTVSQSDIRHGLLAAQVAGRFQIIANPIRQILDVGHNPHGIRQLKINLQSIECQGKTRAVFAMMADKDIATVIEIIREQIDEWYIGGLAVPRAASEFQLHQMLSERGVEVIHSCGTIAQAYSQALTDAGPADQLVIFGSFFTISTILEEMEKRQPQNEAETWNIIPSSNA